MEAFGPMTSKNWSSYAMKSVVFRKSFLLIRFSHQDSAKVAPSTHVWAKEESEVSLSNGASNTERLKAPERTETDGSL